MSTREVIAKQIEPQAWAALGIGDTIAYRNRRVSSERKADRIIAALNAAGYVILSPGEVRGMERDRQAVEFAARWCWRTDPPNAHNKLTDAERLSVIKHHPTIKKYGQPHIELAERENSLKGSAP